MKERIRRLCLVEEAYPPARAFSRDLWDAELLSVPYAGAGGELAAHLQYLFAACVLETTHPLTMTWVFSCIGEVEHLHLLKLAQMIVSLGGTPAFVPSPGRAGALSCLDERHDARALLSAACERERREIVCYRRIFPMLRDEGARALVSRLLRDEERHLEIFEALLAERM